MNCDELKKAVDSFTKAEVSWLNKIFQGVGHFKMVDNGNVVSNTTMTPSDSHLDDGMPDEKIDNIKNE